MPDIASLGVEAKASGVDQTAKALDRLTGAAKRAEAATESIGPISSKAGAMASQAANAHATALNAEAAAATRASGALRAHAAAANTNVRSLGAANSNVANLAAQFQDIGVSAAMSMNPLQIALQQGTQIGAVLGPMGAAGAVKSLGTAFLSIISPVSLVTIGLVAAVAAGLQIVDWAKVGAAALVGVADSLEVIAPYAIAAAGALALLYAPAIIGGVVQLIALLGRLAVAAVIAAGAMAAANPGLAFILGITAAVAAANLFRDELTKIFGFDIVKSAKDGVNALIATFVGAYQGIKATWKQLPGAIGDIVFQTVNATIKGVEKMINAIVKLMNDYIGGLYNSIGGLAKKVGVDIGSFSNIGEVSFGPVANPFAGQAEGVDKAVADAIKAAQGTDYIGNFGTAIANGASKGSEKLKELAKDLLSVDDEKKKKGGKTEAEKYEDIVKGANHRIASLKAEQAAVGLTEEAAAKFRYEQDLLNQAQQKGITLTAAQKAELSGLAGEMASIEAATKKAKEAFDFAKDATGGFLSDLRSGLQNGEGFFKSFGNAAMNVIDKIVDKLQDDLVNALFSVNKAGGSGGIGGTIMGFVNKLFGIGGGSSFQVTPGAGLFANGGAFAGGVQRFANGGTFTNSIVSSPTKFRFAKGTGLMGEAGPEAIMPLTRDSSGRLGVAANGGGTNGAPLPLDIRVSVDDDGKLAVIARQAGSEAGAQQADKRVKTFSKRELPDRLNEIKMAPRKR